MKLLSPVRVCSADELLAARFSRSQRNEPCCVCGEPTTRRERAHGRAVCLDCFGRKLPPLRAEVLVFSGARSARYVIEADSAREAERIAMADAKSRVPRLRNLEIVQTIWPLTGWYDHRPLKPHPEFERVRVRRDGR